ncbi:MAG: FAD-dependent oxidoreductase [Saprospiraceae bacterium]|nr:FAD-dependent oxidoreductase [Saprospiraceae bacterium]
MITTWYEAELIGSKEETKGTNRFWFRINSEQPVEYEAGQFFTFDLPIGEKRLDRWRSYSIANTFDKSNIIELCVSYKKNGLASEYFFNEINKGDLVKFKGPEGNFIIPKFEFANIVMLATGTGVVPFRAILQKIDQEKIKTNNLHLIFGTRKYKDILYLEELEDFAHFIDGLKIDICLSREKKLPKNLKNIHFHSGYIHQIYMNLDLKIIQNSLFMVCGWNNMLDESVANLLTKLKVDKKNIKLEMFG